MSSLNVLFFACQRLEFTTLQPSKVDGLADAACGLPREKLYDNWHKTAPLYL